MFVDALRQHHSSFHVDHAAGLPYVMEKVNPPSLYSKTLHLLTQTLPSRRVEELPIPTES
jgi:hypothetical protein